MKFFIVGFFIFNLCTTHDAFAANQKRKLNNQTEISFEDLLIQGKFHFSNEAVVTVEDDKILDSLLGVRKDFKDRLLRSASRY